MPLSRSLSGLPIPAHFLFTHKSHFLRQTFPATTLWKTSVAIPYLLQCELRSVVVKGLPDLVATILSSFSQACVSAFYKPLTYLSYVSPPMSGTPLPAPETLNMQYHCYLCSLILLLPEHCLADLNSLQLAGSVCSSLYGNRNNGQTRDRSCT